MGPKVGADPSSCGATEEQSCDRDNLSHPPLALTEDDDEEACRTSVTIPVFLFSVYIDSVC